MTVVGRSFDLALEVLASGLKCDEALAEWMTRLQTEGLRYCPIAQEQITASCIEETEDEEIEDQSDVEVLESEEETVPELVLDGEPSELDELVELDGGLEFSPAQAELDVPELVAESPEVLGPVVVVVPPIEAVVELEPLVVPEVVVVEPVFVLPVGFVVVSLVAPVPGVSDFAVHAEWRRFDPATNEVVDEFDGFFFQGTYNSATLVYVNTRGLPDVRVRVRVFRLFVDDVGGVGLEQLLEKYEPATG